MAAPFRGFLTSHNGSSVNFLGDGTIFWGDGNFAGAMKKTEARVPLNESLAR